MPARARSRSPRLIALTAAALLGCGASGGGGEPIWYYHFVCNGDAECLATNFAGAPSGTSAQGPGQAGVAGCNGLLHFGNQFWNIPPAQQWCDTSPGMNPPPTPGVTVSLSPATVDAGQPATLAWSSTLMTACTASGAWSGSRATSGSLVVAPPDPGSYRYVLSCTGPSGPATGSATLTVAVPPPSVSLAVSPATITLGQSATLAWTTWQYTACTASGPTGGTWSGARALRGTEVVTPSAPGTYAFTLGCLSATEGARSGSATLTVLPASGPPPPAPPTVTISGVTEAFPCVDAGLPTTLSWSSSGAAACTASGAWDGPVATSGSQVVFPGVASATSNTMLEYALTCEGPGGSASAVTTVCVVPPSNPTPPPRPTVSLAATPTSIALGESATLAWTSLYASACTASDAWTGLRALGGQLVVTPPSTGIFTYQLSCQGYQGSGSAIATLSVQVASGTVPLAARFCQPQGLAIDGEDSLYVADTNNLTIRKITRGGVVSTVAGLAGYPGFIDGLGGSARFSAPAAVAVGPGGTLWVADMNNDAIRLVAPDGLVTTLAGRPSNLANGVPTDGTGALASFHRPTGVVVDTAGTAFVADYGLGAIRSVTPAGEVATLAGIWGATGAADGTGAAARFFGPAGIVRVASGDLFVADTGNHTIRRVTPAGEVTTFAGTPGVSGSADGQGTAATFFHPHALAVDGQGNLFVTDKDNKKVRRITPGGLVSTFAGSGAHGAANGPGDQASFYYPAGIAIDSADAVYVTDGGGGIRRITPDGTVSLHAGDSATCGTNN